MSEDKFAPELRFHHAIPKWCELVGVKIREIPECEGGGYMVPEEQARMIVASQDLLAACKEAVPHLLRMTRVFRDQGARPIVERLQDAIAKAEEVSGE